MAGGEKTEKATPKKRKDTRKKGEVLQSKEVAVAVFVVGIFAFLAIFGNYMFILYFFLTNGHLSYIKLFHISYETLPIGFSGFTADVPWALVTYFSTVLTLAVKLAAPIIAIEFITEICLGVLMKAVPSIHIFALNIQLKVLIGLAAVLIMAQPMSDFIEKLMGIMWQNLYGLLGMMGS